jgi:hypothetical protein
VSGRPAKRRARMWGPVPQPRLGLQRSCRSPPGPTIVKRRCRGNCPTSLLTVPARPINRVSRTGRLSSLLVPGASGASGVACSASVTGATKGGPSATVTRYRLPLCPSPQRLAQHADLELEVALFDNGVGPNTRYEFFLADHLTGARARLPTRMGLPAPATAVVPEAGEGAEQDCALGRAGRRGILRPEMVVRIRHREDARQRASPFVICGCRAPVRVPPNGGSSELV